MTDLNIPNIYTSDLLAKEEIWRRWNDQDLKKEILLFLKEDIPSVLTENPRIFLARNVATPNEEFLEFLRVSNQVDLKPLILEYTADKFVSMNKDKYYLANLLFHNEKEEYNKINEDVKNIVDMSRFDGTRISEIKTRWGESLVEFHHRMLQEVSTRGVSFLDMSQWVMRQGGTARSYYVHFLALFICHGVLAEVYLPHIKKEVEFVDEVVMPAIDRLHSLFGFKPLITPIFHSKNIDQLDNGIESWMLYPESAKKILPNELSK